MPRPGEDRSDVGGAAQFNNIGPVPLSRSRPAFSDPRLDDVAVDAQLVGLGDIPVLPRGGQGDHRTPSAPAQGRIGCGADLDPADL